MIIARFRDSRYLVRESEVFTKDKTEVASRCSENSKKERKDALERVTKAPSA